MKKYILSQIFFLLVIAALTVSLASCAGDSAVTDESTVSEETSSQMNESTTDKTETPKKEYYEYNGYYFDKQSPLDEASVTRFAKKLNDIKSKYADKTNRVFYSVIPDRGYFVEDKNFNRLDYDKMFEILKKDITDIEYIDIFGELSLDSYYKTDIHWRQEKLFPTVNTLGEAMGFTVDEIDFTAHEYKNYIGMYDDKNAVGETLYYMTSPDTDNAVTDNYQNPEYKSIYSTEFLESGTVYDVFLHGATPLITITNDKAENDGKLIIFRDSFGSSLVPLLSGQYKTIVLVDIRYIMSSMLSDYVDFSGADILFLYNTAVINRSLMLK